MQEMELRNRAGYQTHVTSSDKWAELAPGWYAVVYGVYDGMAEATAAAGELKSRGVSVYVKYSGSLKTGEVLPAPRRGETQHNEVPPPPAAPGLEAKVKQLGAGDEDAVNAVRNVWDQHFTKCGDSYLALGSDNILRQLKGVTIDVSQRYPLTEADKRDGLEWNGKVSAKWPVSRRATRLSSGWVWEDWKESRQTRVFNVTRKNSEWKVLDVLYDQKKIECSEVPL